MPEQRKLIGRIGVDSGQLMVADPYYIDQEWQHRAAAPIRALEFWGRDAQLLSEYAQAEGQITEGTLPGIFRISSPADEVTDADYNRLRQQLEHICTRRRWKVVFAHRRAATYDDICEVTASHNQAGHLPHTNGHCGLLTAFRSELGDGVYDVYATYHDFGALGERITKVEIELIPGGSSCS